MEESVKHEVALGAEHPSQPELTPECVEYCVWLGVRGAARVDTFLRAFGLCGSPERPIRLPAELLIGLELALRFWIWEQCGITAHVDAGLPGAEQVLKRVLSLREGRELDEFVDKLGLRAAMIQHEQFAWQAGVELGAEIAVNPGDDEEAFLDAMADFLWSHRKQLNLTKEPK